jgi:predicted O-methyltransferase YrrM
LLSDEEREDAWARVRSARGLRTITPAVSEVVPRSPSEQIRAIGRMAGLTLADSDYRHRTRRVLRGHLSRVKRDLLSAVALRALRRARRRGRVRRVDLERARNAWGNPIWSAATTYVGACMAAAGDTEGSAVECGSGFSSAVLGIELARDGRALVALEHDRDWAAVTRRRLRVAGIRNVRVLHRPLRPRGAADWYDVAPDDLPDRVGLVACDGPPGQTRGGRSGMLPALRRAIDDDTVIVLDDVDRPEERATAQDWAAELGFRMRVSAVEPSQRRRHAVLHR